MRKKQVTISVFQIFITAILIIAIIGIIFFVRAHINFNDVNKHKEIEIFARFWHN